MLPFPRRDVPLLLAGAGLIASAPKARAAETCTGRMMRYPLNVINVWQEREYLSMASSFHGHDHAAGILTGRRSQSSISWTTALLRVWEP